MQAKHSYWHYQLFDRNLSTTVCQKSGFISSDSTCSYKMMICSIWRLSFGCGWSSVLTGMKWWCSASRRSVYRRHCMHILACTQQLYSYTCVKRWLFSVHMFPYTLQCVPMPAVSALQVNSFAYTSSIANVAAVTMDGGFFQRWAEMRRIFLLYVHQGGLLLITFNRPLFVAKKALQVLTMRYWCQQCHVPLTFQWMAMKSHVKELICFQF